MPRSDPTPLPPMRRLTVAVTEVEYEAVKARAASERRSVAAQGGRLIGEALRFTPAATFTIQHSSGVGSDVSAAAAAAAMERAARPRALKPVEAAPEVSASDRPRRSRKAGSAATKATCRHGTMDCRVCGTGRYAS